MPGDYVEGRTPAWMSARRRLVKAQPGFWRNLRLIPDGRVIVEEMRKVGFRIVVLTKGPRSNSRAWMEKVEWCAEHLPDAQVTITGDPATRDGFELPSGKGLVYGRVLFDDWIDYTEAWLEWRPRGLVVMMDWPHNQGYDRPEVFRWRRDLPYREMCDQHMALGDRLREAYARP